MHGRAVAFAQGAEKRGGVALLQDEFGDTFRLAAQHFEVALAFARFADDVGEPGGRRRLARSLQDEKARNRHGNLDREIRSSIV